MNPAEIKTEIEAIRQLIDNMHASKPFTPEEKARLLQVLVYLRFRNEVVER